MKMHHMHHAEKAKRDASIELTENNGKSDDNDLGGKAEGGGHGHNFGHGHSRNHGLGHGHGHNAAMKAPAVDATSTTRGQNKGYVVIAVIYLLGLCMGALDMGIVNPARTVIQNTLGVDDSLGVWILTIYTLAYAASIPIMGKLADRHGRKYIYLACIVLFGGGSALCGVAHGVGSFPLLIAARAIQALGGGGIMPVATAEFGTAFPEEKRGMALGMVGMVYGLASIFGSSAGSLILDIFGQTQWQFIFYVNIPICLVILALGIFKLPNSKADTVPPIDILGALVLTVMTLSLMYGLKNIDFFNLRESIATTDVYPFLIAFAVLLPAFILVERRAKDPVMNLSYFRNPNILIALVCSVISGIIMMGTIFFPQFAENSLFLKSGAGGYFIMILGVGSGFGAMLSGKLIDKFGVKPVLAAGFVGSLAGSLFMALVACNNPTLFNVCAMLALTGAGLGFTMGTPLNYMMLQNTADKESNSALATMSLVRSIGTAVAPAIMVAFVAHAGLSMQDNIMAVLPDEVSMSPLPYAEELDSKLNEMRADEDTAEMLEGLDIPKLASYQTMDIQMNGDDPDFDVEVSDEMIQKMQDSDVTTIVATCKDMTAEMFGQVKPKLVKKATDGIDKGIDAMQNGLGDMDDAIAELEDGMSEMDDKLSEMRGGMSEMSEGISGIQSGIDQMDGKLSEMKQNISDMDKAISGVKSGMDEMDGKIADMKEGVSKMDQALAGIKSGINEMDGKISEMHKGIEGMNGALAGMESGITEMDGKISEMQSGISEMDGKIAEMQIALKEAEDEGDETKAGELRSAISEMQGKREEMQTACGEVEKARDEAKRKYDEVQTSRDEMQAGCKEMQAARDKMQGEYDEMKSNRDKMQTGSKEMKSARNKMKSKREKLKSARDGMKTGSKQMQSARDEMERNRDEMQSARDEMEIGYSEMQSARKDMQDARFELKDARGDLSDTIAKLKEVRAEIPGTFDEAETNYLEEIDEVGPQIQEVYRSTLNGGFKGMAFFVAACAAFGLLALIPYRNREE